MAKIKANANIRIPVATAANYLSGRNSVSKQHQTVNVSARPQCQTSTHNKDLSHPQGAGHGKTPAVGGGIGGQREGGSVGYRTRNKRNVVSQARDAVQQYATIESRNMSSTVQGDVE